MVLALPESGANAVQHRAFVTGNPRRIARGKFHGVAQPWAAQAFGDGLCSAELRLDPAAVDAGALRLCKSDPGQAFKPRNASLDRDCERHLHLAMRVRDIDVGRGGPST